MSDAQDDLMLRYLAGPIDDTELLRVEELLEDPDTARRLAELALIESMLPESRPVPGPGRSRPSLRPLLYAAALTLIGVVAVIALRREPPPAEVVREQPKAAVIPTPGPELPAPGPEPRPEPAPTPPDSPSTAPWIPAAIDEPRGGPLTRRPDGSIFTSHRGAASFLTNGAVRVFLDSETTIRLETREGGPLRITLVMGRVLLETSTPVLASSEMADAFTHRGVLQLERNDLAATALVVEGRASYRTTLGGVWIAANQCSTARKEAKPSTPIGCDAAGLASWRTAPSLRPNLDATAFMDFEKGGNKKLAGLAIGAPYSDEEIDAGRIARAVARRLDTGLALGHNYCSATAKLWIRIDRGLVASLNEDGTLSKPVASDRARQLTEQYLELLRASTGVRRRAEIPVIVQFREHALKDRDVGEVAWTGWSQETMIAAKALYAALIDQHKPARRIDLKFQQLDDTYELDGTKLTFAFPETEPRLYGYMDRKQALCAASIFLPVSFGTDLKEIDEYAPIFAELVEFLNSKRR